jgi:hypothetical protein
MFRRFGLCVVVIGALAAVPSASAAFPAPYAAQGGKGVLSNDGSMRFVAVGAGESTIVRASTTDAGSVAMSQTIAGSFGVPMITQNGPGGGMFRDGSTFVLQSIGLNPSTQFVLLRTQDLSTRDKISLNGTFGFDALSPDGSMLYLIQHSSTQDIEHYVVRAYDLNVHKLLPGRIADKSQRSWVMQGWAVSRVTSANGRWVYTLYANPGGYPFIHALDTVKGVAHCVGLPWPATDGNQNQVFNFSLALGPQGKTLAVKRQGGMIYRYVNTANWKVSKHR